MNRIKMFSQCYDDIPRYTKQLSDDKFQQIEIDIPIKRMLMPLRKNIKEIDTSSTTHCDSFKPKQINVFLFFFMLVKK